ncbi:MAG: hypothetical protein O2994_01445 [Proteobacteria bacterium]|nr:hypothetical protein [Pseudomonadota bacterium]MDA1153680.1 hypothetical protein [Pseudomonadota bacterium]
MCTKRLSCSGRIGASMAMKVSMGIVMIAAIGYLVFGLSVVE